MDCHDSDNAGLIRGLPGVLPEGLLACHLAGRCSGCGWITRSYPQQLAEKISTLKNFWTHAGLPEPALENISLREIAPAGFRERADLVYSQAQAQGALGLYEIGRRQILPIDQCPQMSFPLQAFFNEVKRLPVPVKLGSLRLRVSGEMRGAWLDFSNEDIKRLLEEETYLRALQNISVVEIGQKRKRLIEKNGGLALGAPQLAPWTVTPIASGNAPLYSTIGSFSQAGRRANAAIVAEMLAGPFPVEGNWLELGAGIGTLTLPLADAGARVIAIENDPLATEGLRESAEKAQLKPRIEIRTLNFYRPGADFAAVFSALRGMLVDPPRSGLREFTEFMTTLPATSLPPHLIYVSCATESFVKDSVNLYRLGYRLERVRGVDQFPQTPHVEWVAHFRR